MKCCIVFLILLTFLVAGEEPKAGTWYSVIDVNNHYKIVEGKQVDGSLAWGIYNDDTFTDGWGKLTLHSDSFKEVGEAYAVGFLEGALTRHYIKHHKTNFYDQMIKPAMKSSLDTFVTKQWEYTQSMVTANPGDVYWGTVGLYASLFEGLVNGYNEHVLEVERISHTDFLILQTIGDIFDIEPVLSQGTVNEVDWFALSDEEFRRHFMLNTHCSSLIKIKDDLSDVFMGHTSWNQGHVMLRTYKFYNFGNDVKMQFTSYPGVIFSLDDYYILQRPDQMIFVTETSNAVMDTSIYKNVVPDSVLCWQRVMVANTLATDGETWTETFKKFHSGTYNNQYIIVDTKYFVPGEGAKPNFLWIVEEFPGLIMNRDVTSVMIQQGNYWPSYNVPYFREMFNYAGYDKAVQKMGPEMSYGGAPRARIFKRDHAEVQTFEQYKRIIRYNQFQTDHVSDGDPTATISARGDLYPKGKEMAFFAYDAKATSYLRIVNEDGCIGFSLSDIQNGPTHDDQPVFRWSDFNFTASHQGHPDEWNFPWISVRPAQ